MNIFKRRFYRRGIYAAMISMLLIGIPIKICYAAIPNAPIISSPTDQSVVKPQNLTISGTADIGSTITLEIEQTEYKDIVVTDNAGTGKWNFTPSPALPDGSYTITATATDAGGSTSAPSNAVTITIDATPPSSPEIDNSLNNSITNNVRKPITGRAEPKASIKVYIDGTLGGPAVTASDSGDWSFTSSTDMSERVHKITATATDIAGNTSALSAETTLTIDNTKPAVPVIINPIEGFNTNDTTSTISGTSEPNVNIVLCVDNQDLTLPITANPSGNWAVYLPLLEGPHTISAKAIDLANNTSNYSSPVRNFTIDITPPIAPVIINTNGTVNTSKPTINGTINGTSGSFNNIRITLYLNGNIQANSIIVNSNGSWSYTPAANLADGNYVFSARAYDLAYNNSSLSNSVSITITTTTTTVATPTISPSLNNSYTNGQSLVINGTAVANAKITLKIDNIEYDNFANSDGSGNWSNTVPILLTPGVHTFYAKATNNANITSAYSSLVYINVDITPPNPPVIDSRFSNTTFTTQRPTITGTGEPYARITLYLNGSPFANSTTVDSNGYWSFTPSTNTADGTYTLTARAYDQANNQSNVSNNVIITIITTSMGVPIINPSLNNSTTNNSRVTINGTAVVNSRITLILDGIEYPNFAITDIYGNWTGLSPIILTNGSHYVYAKATNTSNVTSPNSSIVYFNVNAVLLNQPVIDSKFSNMTINTQNPTITGTGAPNATLILTVDGIDQAYLGSVNSSGIWSYTLQNRLSDGVHAIFVKVRDAAGNVSQASVAINITVTSLLINTPVISTPTNGALSNTSRPLISGSADTNAQIIITIDGVENGAYIISNSSGYWSYTPVSPLPDGVHTIYAKAQNGSGIRSSQSGTITITIHTVTPRKPTITNPVNKSFAKNTKITINGQAEASSKITLTINGRDIVDCSTADAGGSWSYSVQSGLIDGINTISAKAKDNIGNLGEVSDTITFTVDLTAPAKPIIDSPADNSVVKNQFIELSGATEPNCSIKIMIDNAVQDDIVTADSMGKWKVRLKNTIKDGKHTITVKAIDGAGNESVVSQLINIKVDNTPPGVPKIITPLTGANIENQKLEVVVLGDANATIIVYIDGKEIKKSDLTGNNGIYNIAINDNLTSGVHTLSVAAMDLSGNLSNLAPEKTINIISKTPNKPIIKMPVNNVKTKNKKPLILGFADPKITIIVTITDGKSTSKYTVKADSDGLWSVNLPKNLKPSKYKITAIAKNSANRSSLSSNQVNISIIK